MPNEFHFTDKQAALVRAFANDELKRINIIEGSVRSGKTYSTLIIWALWLAQMPRDGRYLMVGNTLTTLKRNCLEPLMKLLGPANMSYSVPNKTARIFNRLVDLEGASDARSEGKIRGITLTGAYVDELTLAPRDFFVMLLSRLSEPGAKLIATTNPDAPRHWLKTEYLDAEGLSLYKDRFLLDDNTTLNAEYVANLKREYTGVFYRRFILGEWVAAEGAIYPMFDIKRHVSNRVPDRTRVEWIGVDYGHTNPTAFLRLASGGDGKIWILDEYYHDVKDGTPGKSPQAYALDLIRFAEKGKSPDVVAIDPSAEGFIIQLKQDAPNLAPRIRRADNAVLDGIRLVSSAMDAGLIRIHPRCKNLIDELQGYMWDAKAQARGEDKPVKTKDHSADALRYGLMAYRREIMRMVVDSGRNVSPGEMAVG